MWSKQLAVRNNGTYLRIFSSLRLTNLGVLALWAMDFAPIALRHAAAFEQALQRAPKSDIPALATSTADRMLDVIQQQENFKFDPPKNQAFASAVLAPVQAMQMHFPESSFNKIVDALCNQCKGKAIRSWSMQNYASVFSYLTEAEWTRFLDGNHVPAMRLVFEVAERLGCHRPGEETTRWWNSVLLAHSQNHQALAVMPAQMLH